LTRAIKRELPRTEVLIYTMHEKESSRPKSCAPARAAMC
jgi:hypothetical protein